MMDSAQKGEKRVRNIAILTAILSGTTSSVAMAQATSAGEQAVSQGGLGDIIVTAQRREQRLQDVPVTVNAISAVGLERQGIVSTADLNSVVPGLSLTKSSTVVQPFLRGVGTASLAPGNDPSVPLYIDGVYHSAPSGTFFAFNNIERVEVLKGPQGTLFGRNATGGLIQVVTKDPTPGFSGKVSVGYGNYNALSTSAYLSGGTDTISASLSILFNKQWDGWGKNTYQVGDGGPIIVGGNTITEVAPTPTEAGYNEEFGIHGKVMITPDDRTTIKLSGMYIDVDGNQNHYRNPLPGRLVAGPPGQNPYTYTGSFYDYNSDVPWRNQNNQYLFSAEATHDADFATLKSITSYLKADASITVPSDANPLISRASSVANLTWKTFTQELQLLSSDDFGPDWLEWIVGFYYLNSRSGYDPQEVNFGARYDGTFDRYSFQTTDSLAGYGQITASITPTTRITGGLRYSKDTIHGSQYKVGTSAVLGGTNAAGVVSILVPGVSTSFDKVTWRAAIDQRVTSDVLLYASASRGYKAGTWNHGSMCITDPGVGGSCSGTNLAPPVEPEVLDAYEIGLKSDLFDRRLRFNISGYHYDYKNMQVQVTIGVPPISVLTNAATAKIWGADFETVLQATDNLRLSFNAAYVDGRFGKYPGATLFTPLTVAPYGNAATLGSADGNRMPRAPKFTSTVSVDWTIPASFGDITVSGSWYHNDGFYWDVEERMRESSYNLVNGQIAVQLSDSVRARIWGRNILDEKYYSFQTATSVGDQGAPGAPATFGFAVDYEF